MGGSAVFDGSRSTDRAGKPLAFAWSSTDQQLQAAVAAASGDRLLLSAETVKALPVGTYTLQLTVTNWLGATGGRADPKAVVGGRQQAGTAPCPPLCLPA